MRIHNGTVPDTVLIDAATTHDGVAPLSEQFLRGLSEPELGHTHAYILADDQVVALAAGDGASWELVVHPAYRRRRVGAWEPASGEGPGGGAWVGVDTRTFGDGRGLGASGNPAAGQHGLPEP